MKLTFLISAYDGRDAGKRQKTVEYCRLLSKMGYTPIAPHLYLSQLYNYSIPEEKAAALAVSLELLRRSSLVVLCDCAALHDSDIMQQEIMQARQYGKYRTTMDGLTRANRVGRSLS